LYAGKPKLRQTKLKRRSGNPQKWPQPSNGKKIRITKRKRKFLRKFQQTRLGLKEP